MYEEYFGLSGAPFRLNPDPKFFFGSRGHNKAMAYLHYGLKQAEGFIVITGSVGVGKSILIGHLLDQLHQSNVVAANLLTSRVEPDELLSHILSAFRIEPEAEGRAGQLEAFEDYLFDQLNRGRRVLLIMDEAQNLPGETLEELRMLSNIDYDGTPLFQVFLVGQSEFRDAIDAKDMEQLRQRVIASYHLENLTKEETREYVLHRLAVVGWREDPAFSDEAFEAIHDEANGLPRRINTVCNRLMLYCALEKRHEITRDVVDVVLAELREEKLESKDAKPVSLPPVKSINGGKPDAAKTERKLAPEEDVVVSLDSARAKTFEDDASESGAKDAARKDGSMGDETQMEKNDALSKETPPVAEPAASSMSVFDRLRSKRGEKIRQPKDEPPQEATLKDVASAIEVAVAKSKSKVLREASAQNPEDAAPPSPNFAAAAAEFPAAREIGGEWRKSVVKSINETRDELKQAHANVSRLRRKMSEIARRRYDDRAKIVASLTRAETLLGEIQDASRRTV